MVLSLKPKYFKDTSNSKVPSSPFLIQPLLLLLEITVSLTFIKIPLLFFILSATMKCIILSSFIQCHIFKINPYCLY